MHDQFRLAPYATVPLGPGDLIDRAVRFYRRNFWTFVFIAAPPVVTGTLISVGWIFVALTLFSVGTTSNTVDYTLYLVFVWLGTLLIWFTEIVVTLSVIGGASRNFGRHLLFGEPSTFRETHANTWKRMAGLLAASSIKPHKRECQATRRTLYLLAGGNIRGTRALLHPAHLLRVDFEVDLPLKPDVIIRIRNGLNGIIRTNIRSARKTLTADDEIEVRKDFVQHQRSSSAQKKCIIPYIFKILYARLRVPANNFNRSVS